MAFYQLAFRYLKRKKSKTILLFFVLFIVSSMILSTNMILRATADSKAAIGEKTKAKVVMGILKEENKITLDDVEWIKGLAEVSTVNCLARNTAFPVNFQLITGSDSTEESNQKASVLSYDNLENDSGFSEGDHLCVEGACDYSRKLLGGRPFYGGMYVEQYYGDPDRFQRAVKMNLKKSDGFMLFDMCHIIYKDWFDILGKAIAEAEEEMRQEQAAK